MKYCFKFLLSLLVLSSLLFAQQTKINQLNIVGNSEILEGEIISNENRDVNGNVCAGLSIQTDLTGLSFDSNNGIVKLVQKPGEYLLYLSPNERVVTIRKTGFKPLKIILNDYGINLSSGKVWKLEITGDKKLDLIPVNIITIPNDADIYIDGEFKGNGTTFQVSDGEHDLRIEKKGYKTINKKVNINVKSNLFNFTLKELEPVKVTFKTKPTNAKLTLDGIDKGMTDRDLFLFPGSYRIQLNKSGYLDINKTITVKPSGKNIFSYNLSKNSVTLTLNITPSGAVVLINKENYSNRSNIELAPGRYLIEVSKDGYNKISEYTELELGKPVTKTFKLNPKKGTLQLTVKPIDAEVKLEKNKKIIKKWSGSQYLKNLIIGKYNMEISKSGYASVIKPVEIKENKTSVIDVVLKKSTSLTIAKSNNDMVIVEGGTFQMGSTIGGRDEKPVHNVTLSSFYISKYEVTQAEWRAVMETNPSKFSGDKLPVEGVSWYDAVEYCNKLSEMEGLEKFYTISGSNVIMNWGSKGYRLPTEAEWEYACRGGIHSASYTYSGSDNIDDVAWYDGNSGNKTHNVGTKSPNELGIYDMSGNVWEWCNDWYDDWFDDWYNDGYSSSYYGSSPSNDPRGPNSGFLRVLRGGSWYNDANYCRSAYRGNDSPGSGDGIGFRIARTP